MPLNMPTPGTSQNRMKFTPREYRNGILGVLLVLLIIFSYAFEFKHFSNTFGVEKLVVRALLFGLVAAIVAGYFYSKRYSDDLDKLKTYLFFIFGFLFLAPLMASLSNRHLTFNEVKNENVIFVKQESYIKSRFGKVQTSPDGAFLFFQKEQKIERVKTKNILFPEAVNGDRVSINVKKGFWGFEYFLEN